MSNTSYPFQENKNNVMHAQGGEKKVMKKILSVALSTAMAFSMFASVAFGDTAKLSPQDKFDALKVKGIFSGDTDGLAHLERDMTRAEFAKVITKVMGLKEITGTYSYNDKGYNNPKNWAAPFIEAVSAAGVMQGKDLTKKLFDQKANVTVQELAEVLVKAMKLEIPTKIDNTATEWAKGSVQAAINAGLLSKDLNFQANANRSLLVEAAFAAEAALNPVVPVVTTATKVEKVSATNLKEVTVAFDGTVDEDTATDVTNYSLKSGKALKTAVLSDDKKTVTIELVGTLNNNKVDYLTVSNIKAGTIIVNAKDSEFSIADNELPKVESVKSLGTKSVKVVFSEPVQLPAQGNFELDGKTYFGKITQPTLRTVVLTPYNTSALSVGDHKLAVVGVKDHAGFVSLTTSHDIKVVEDKDAPTITAATATLESVTLTFSEEVDPETLDADNVYWKSGSSKLTATGSATALADNKYKFTFDKANSLPTGAVLIYVDGVKDYSGNQIAKDTSISVNAEIDQTRPEVRKAEAIDSKHIQVTFSKALLEDSVKEIKNYNVLDKDGKVISVKEAKRGGKDNNVITIELYTALSTGGNNAVTIKNIKDNTRLGNTMLDFSGKVNLADVTNPKLDSKLVNKNSRTVIVGFDKKMDAATLADHSNYHVQINGDRVTLTPELADITVLNDSNAVSIKFVETYKGQDVIFAAGNSTSAKHIQKLYVLGVKDTAGNLVTEFSNNSGDNVIPTDADLTVGLSTIDKDYAGFKAALTAQNTIEVKLSSGVTNAPKEAFTVTSGGTEVKVKEVVLNGTSTVKLKLVDDFGTDASSLNVSVDVNRLQTLAGVSAGVLPQSTAVLDKVAPVAKSNVSGGYKNLQVSGNDIKVEFSELIDLDRSANEDLLAKDFEVIRYSDNKKLVAGIGFVVNVNAQDVTITLKDSADRTAATKYTVNFAGSKYLTDRSVVKNEVASFSGKETNMDVAFTKAAKLTVTGPSTIAVVNPAVPVQYTTVVKDQNDVVDTHATVSYAIVGAGATVSATGVVTVNPTATAGSVILRVTSTSTSTATPPVTTTGTTDYTISLTKGASVVSNVVVSPATSTSVAGTPVTKTFTAAVNDQYGAAIVGSAVNWSLVGAPAGVSLSTTGELTVAGSVAAGSFQVVATSAVDSSKSGSVAHTITAAPLVATTIDITGAAGITKAAGTVTGNYVASVKDQNGAALATQPTVAWTVTGDPAVTVSSTGVVSVGPTVTAASVTLTATVGTITKNFTITIN
ncbi:autotransporter outer membrane beta-barrel domain-containing protein [Paenibacillus macquariensis]|uniref:S-layer homology domain-containing protein n=1 Tax=Paenibacillus macquariensis TaxID=948756 RepID=A0ABY1K719_9BACL|nr:hypothetical protein [Paenibacillus macquariensis]MEC0092567.1 hypothetical protein [Paenibacillus macquariensis]OAB35518.1 hypothetical protein PMSM_09710 [Paenibacillus macquariensis subsp. macquariensis]SIR34421.1 S-layer homology domain-containing protein [Paenibacillus macquariensis]